MATKASQKPSKGINIIEFDTEPGKTYRLTVE